MSVARSLTWPIRRLLDPRFGGLAEQADAQHSDIAIRLDRLERSVDALADKETLREELTLMRETLTALAEADVEATREANELMGRTLGDLLAEASSTTAALESLDRRLQLGADLTTQPLASVEDLDASAARFLNYAASHEGFAAQRGLWFNPPISLIHEEHDVRPTVTNERIVEVPYVYRALGRLEAGALILDVGAAESTLAFSLASLGYEVTALDIRGYPLNHPRLRSITADILEWEADRTFDAVLCVSTLEHVGLEAYDAEPTADGADARALERMKSLTREGGMLVLTVPVGSPADDATQRSYDLPNLESLLEGWAIEDLKVARQRDDLTWCVEERGEDQSGGRKVALVTAVRPN
jgi:SAM-dependent methyltransferase